MNIPATTRRRITPAASVCLLIAATLALALSSTGPADRQQRTGPRSLVASAGHRAAVQLHRAAGPFACVLPATFALPAHAASPLLPAPSSRPWSLDRLGLETGRSPPSLS